MCPISMLLLILVNARFARFCQLPNDCPPLMECCDGVCERMCSAACLNDSVCQLSCVKSICTRKTTENADRNVTDVNSTKISADKSCIGEEDDSSCGFGKICRSGTCTIKAIDDHGKEPASTNESKGFGQNEDINAMHTTFSPTSTRNSRGTRNHPFLSGNQEFTIALVGFSILFINFCLVSLFFARKRRRIALQRRSEGTQSSLTGDEWNANIGVGNDAPQATEGMNYMGMDNFALNGELDGFSADFVFPQTRLPPYDFSSAYHKPRPITEEENETVELTGATIDVDQDTNEDPPPAYGNQNFENPSRPPPSYDEVFRASMDGAHS